MQDHNFSLVVFLSTSRGLPDRSKPEKSLQQSQCWPSCDDEVAHEDAAAGLKLCIKGSEATEPVELNETQTDESHSPGLDQGSENHKASSDMVLDVCTLLNPAESVRVSDGVERGQGDVTRPTYIVTKGVVRGVDLSYAADRSLWLKGGGKICQGEHEKPSSSCL